MRGFTASGKPRGAFKRTCFFADLSLFFAGWIRVQIIHFL